MENPPPENPPSKDPAKLQAALEKAGFSKPAKKHPQFGERWGDGEREHDYFKKQGLNGYSTNTKWLERIPEGAFRNLSALRDGFEQLPIAELFLLISEVKFNKSKGDDFNNLPPSEESKKIIEKKLIEAFKEFGLNDDQILTIIRENKKMLDAPNIVDQQNVVLNGPQMSSLNLSEEVKDNIKKFIFTADLDRQKSIDSRVFSRLANIAGNVKHNFPDAEIAINDPSIAMSLIRDNNEETKILLAREGNLLPHTNYQLDSGKTYETHKSEKREFMHPEYSVVDKSESKPITVKHKVITEKEKAINVQSGLSFKKAGDTYIYVAPGQEIDLTNYTAKDANLNVHGSAEFKLSKDSALNINILKGSPKGETLLIIMPVDVAKNIKCDKSPTTKNSDGEPVVLRPATDPELNISDTKIKIKGYSSNNSKGEDLPTISYRIESPNGKYVDVPITKDGKFVPENTQILKEAVDKAVQELEVQPQRALPIPAKEQKGASR